MFVCCYLLQQRSFLQMWVGHTRDSCRCAVHHSSDIQSIEYITTQQSSMACASAKRLQLHANKSRYLHVHTPHPPNQTPTHPSTHPPNQPTTYLPIKWLFYPTLLENVNAALRNSELHPLVRRLRHQRPLPTCTATCCSRTYTLHILLLLVVVLVVVLPITTACTTTSTSSIYQVLLLLQILLLLKVLLLRVLLLMLSIWRKLLHALLNINLMLLHPRPTFTTTVTSCFSIAIFSALITSTMLWCPAIMPSIIHGDLRCRWMMLMSILRLICPSNSATATAMAYAANPFSSILRIYWHGDIPLLWHTRRPTSTNMVASCVSTSFFSTFVPSSASSAWLMMLRWG